MSKNTTPDSQDQFANKAQAWSARFSEPVSDLVKRYTASVGFDQRMAEVDIQGSLAHADMLESIGIISSEDKISIEKGMARILEEIRRSEEHTSELQSLMRISYAVFCLKNKKIIQT